MALENYTKYSEYDASGLVTVAANTLTVAGNNNTAFSVHKVFAAGHFSGDFEHVVAVALNNDGTANMSWCPFWGLSNETAESAHSFKEIQGASGDCLYVMQYEDSDSTAWIRLFEISTGSRYEDPYYGSYDTWYYCEIERDESTGTYGTLLCRIYSDESRSTLVDTLSVTLHKKEDFRTVYAVASYYPNSIRPYSQEIKNLDLQEAGTTHTVTGAITLPALEVSGTATKKHIYEATGAITLPALTVSGTASKKHVYTATGAVTLPALEVSGEAAKKHIYNVTGAIELPALEVAGEAARSHTWEVTGDITLPALEVSGQASKKHVYEATGAITLPALEVSGEAAKKHIYEVTGAIELPALEVAGQATRFHTWEVTGAVTLPALEVAGTAQSSSGKVTHEVTGAIVLPALEVAGEATRFHSWEVTGAVTLPALEVDGQAEIAISLAGGGETDFQVYSSEDEDYVTGMALVDSGLLMAVDWKQRATEAECL